YFLYFLVGTALGRFGLDNEFFTSGGKLARRWPLWSAAAVIAYFSVAAVFLVVISLITAGKPFAGWKTLADFLFTISCAASTFALLSIFIRFAKGQSALLRSFARNAYGIYIVHYSFVIWLQYAFLHVSISGQAKASWVCILAALFSWATAASLKQIP